MATESMEFRNHTPFPALAFEALDQHDTRFQVIVLRVTLTIEAHGALQLSQEQTPLCVSDEYCGGINRSSVKSESDLAPYKPKTDVIVVGTTYAPQGKPTRRYDVQVRIGQHAKTLSVTGPRSWRKRRFLARLARLFRGSPWQLTTPECLTSLPLRYEYACGGEFLWPDEQEMRRAMQQGQNPDDVPPLVHTAADTNPVGRGYLPRRDEIAGRLHLSQRQTKRLYKEMLRHVQQIGLPAPQIEDPHDPVNEFGKHYAIQGFGVITKAWQPRLQQAGSFDDNWLRNRHPGLPENFDFAYWNGAHPDLQVPYLRGNETVELTHLTPEGMLTLALPGLRPFLNIDRTDGAIDITAPVLDTLLIDVDAQRVFMTYRATVDLAQPIDLIEARLMQPEQANNNGMTRAMHNGTTAAHSPSPTPRREAVHG